MNLDLFDGIFMIIFAGLPFVVGALLVIFLCVRAGKAIAKYVRSGEFRRRRQERAKAKNMGEILKDHRVRCGMTPESVAGAVGVSRKAVLRWEKGGSVLSYANLLPLAQLFGVSVEELRGA